MRFGTNAGFQSLLADRDGKLDTTRRVLAGLAAGVTEALIIVTPFETIKIRLQGQVGLDPSQLKYKGPVDAAVKTIQNEVGVGVCACGSAVMCLLPCFRGRGKLRAQPILVVPRKQRRSAGRVGKFLNG